MKNHAHVKMQAVEKYLLIYYEASELSSADFQYGGRCSSGHFRTHTFSPNATIIRHLVALPHPPSPNASGTFSLQRTQVGPLRVGAEGAVDASSPPRIRVVTQTSHK